VKNARRKRNDPMSKHTATIPQFQKYCWGLLPIRKQVLGQEVVFDCIVAGIQFWPVEELSQAETGSKEEADAIKFLEKDINRLLVLLWGDDRYRSFQILGLEQLLPELLTLMLHWWRRRKDNRGRIIIWRRKWCP
jgi:hypothetical protein